MPDTPSTRESPNLLGQDPQATTTKKKQLRTTLQNIVLRPQQKKHYKKFKKWLNKTSPSGL